MKLRSPTNSEFFLINFLVRKGNVFPAKDQLLKEIKVAEMNDGGMGSLRLFPSGEEAEDSVFGRQASACRFTDQDGIEVIASLNLDQHGSPYELDIWKTNFGKLIKIPEEEGALRLEKS